MPGKVNFISPAYTMNLLTNGKPVYICAVLYSFKGNLLWYCAESVKIIHTVLRFFNFPLIVFPPFWSILIQHMHVRIFQ